MKRLNTDLTTSDVGLVLQHKHLDFIQDKTEESLIHSVYAQLGSIKTIPVILYGCLPTISTTTNPNDTLAISDGAISYNGNIYEISGGSVVKTGVNVHLLKLSTVTYDASDPSLFTDNISRDVQEIRKIELNQGATGSGISDWDDVVFLNISGYGACSPDSLFDFEILFTGPSGYVVSADYVVAKSGNTVTVQFFVIYTITSLGGGNNFTNFRFTPKNFLKGKASSNVISFVNNYSTTYDSNNDGGLDFNASQQLVTEYDNTFVAVVGALQRIKLTVTYLTV